MTIMTIRIPDDVKEAFDKAFEGEDKDAVIARLLHEAAEKRVEAEGLAERRRDAVDAILALRKQPPYFSDEDIRRAREEGRP
jgi:alkylhydroperoxidase family enzyme